MRSLWGADVVQVSGLVDCDESSCFCDAGDIYDYDFPDLTPSEACAAGARQCALDSGAAP